MRENAATLGRGHLDVGACGRAQGGRRPHHLPPGGGNF
uniref:Uncharacterized protein n=1 Tax=Siphoviridae sp. ctxS04 TaxID=2823610 RepID=A0A8S5LHP5_9CAUD|nr:MAG TPA: hypothetical protein [Siphoviridae sp. ctxS04]